MCYIKTNLILMKSGGTDSNAMLNAEVVNKPSGSGTSPGIRGIRKLLEEGYIVFETTKFTERETL